MSIKIIDRVFQYLENQGIPPTRFEKEIGLSNGYLSIQRKRNADLGEGVIKKILDNSLQLNIEWLISGNGDMLKDKNVTNTHIKATSISEESQLEYEKLKKQILPLIPIDAMAGYATGGNQVMEYESEKFLVPTFKGADFLISVRGSSMYPKYNSGDIVACKRLSIDAFFQWNKVYVLDTDQGALIKRVKKGKDDEHVLIVSDNVKYEPFELSRADIHALAIVMGVIRLE